MPSIRSWAPGCACEPIKARDSAGRRISLISVLLPAR
jgi:hypothetical protein